MSLKNGFTLGAGMLVLAMALAAAYGFYEAFIENGTVPNHRTGGRLGITVEDVTPEIEAQLNLRSGDGVIVIEVSPGSPADERGVQPGDVIRQVNHLPVHDANNLISALRRSGSDGSVLFLLERQGTTFYLVLHPSQ